jgi:4a-hydroxytetrahydrobiopterin dehydratase
MEPLDDARIAIALDALPLWQRDGEALVRTVRRADFRDALAFIGAVADEAERANHHPDLCLRRYRSVEIRLTTHSAGGITERDVSLARAIDGLAGG